jgi:hypothetical protein
MTGEWIVSIKRRSIVIALLAIPAAFILGITVVTSHSAAAEPEVPAPPAVEYLPSISDMMIATIQPRHIRLWLAAQNKNWAFAAYELGNLRGAFDRLGRAHPTTQDTSLPDMISSVTQQPFTELSAAIQAKDITGFGKAYGDLTSACNSCHQALNHGVVAIRVPSGATDPNQDFTPQKP